jgi:hypothetical protein
MKSRALNEALRLVGKAASDLRIDPDRRDQLLKAKRELEAVARSGKLNEKRMFLAVEHIATVLLEIAGDDVTRR